MSSDREATQFAPAERATEAAVKRQSGRFPDGVPLSQLYDAVSDFVIILNEQRQIVYCNRNFLEFLGAKDAASVHGLRPGEALRCVHAIRQPGGCGTSEFCSACGAVNAVLRSGAGAVDIQECSIMREGDADALDLLVRSSPLELDGERYVVVAISDISHEKRRRALEHIFFHDLMNTTIGIQMLSRSLSKSSGGPCAEMCESIARAADMLADEIEGQRDLLAAETHELAVRPCKIVSTELLEDLRAGYAQFARERGCAVKIGPPSERVEFVSDRKILLRVLRNMLKNALEASRRGETVTLGCRAAGDCVEFAVHNPAFIPRPQQLQIFKRSFSTRGPGRGLGTYSMRLLTERYLKGSISFVSSEADGTMFSVTCPALLPERREEKKGRS